MNHPKVSIIMATYNRGHIVGDTIANVMEQDYPNFELVVVNDGSSDQTYALLEALQYRPPIKIINNSVNMGLQKSLNIGIQQATGTYIARIDDHDKWVQKDKLSKQVAFLEQHPKIGLLGTAYQIGNKKMVNPLTDKDIRAQILYRCPFCHVTVMMRKSIIEKIGGYDESLTYSEDWDLWLRIATHSQVANLSAICAAVTEEKASLSDTYFLKQLPLNRKLIQKYAKAYPGGQKAIWYHRGVQFFFTLFPLNGRIHNLMKRLFLRWFLK